MIAVRDKSVGKHDPRDAQRTQDQLRKNTNAALGNIKKRDLFSRAGFQTKILALDGSRLEPLPYKGASEQIWAANVHGSKAGMSALCQKQTLRNSASLHAARNLL
jgi:hypothetical protein